VQPELPDRLSAVHAASQEAIAAFLVTEIDLAFTMLDVATAQPETRYAAVEHARAALLVVRQFEGRVEDPKLWRAIHQRTDELEAAIHELSEGGPGLKG